ncbi:MAG: hypothetical protein LC620_08945, partial [Halobacteriales archaeon]|nr:hypothetical protein [Halobacteriales archaeon]
LVEWGKPFWDIPYASVRTLTERAVLSHVLTTQKMAPLLGMGSLVVEVTDGDGLQYRGQFLYDLVKATVIRLAFAWHEELSQRGVSSVAVTPGFLRSEAMLDLFGVSESNWRDFVATEPDWAESETPLYVGRAVAALAADPQLARKSGRVFASWTLAREYGFTDADGRRPDWGRHFEKRYGKGLQRPADEGFYVYWEGHGRMMAAVEDRKRSDAT